MTVSASLPRPGWSRPQGLRVELESNGALRTLALGDVVVNLFVGNALEGGPANLLLRRHGATPASTRLLGPSSPTRWNAEPEAGRFDGVGEWNGLAYRVALRLASDAPAWFWHVQVRNLSEVDAEFDLTLWQDLALADYGAIRLNEYYVSQYLDHAPLEHPARGVTVATRQNQAVGGRFPWSIQGSLDRAVAYATDALQVHGRDARAGRPDGARDLPSVRLQHEHAMVALQDRRHTLAPGASVELGFFGRVLAD
ncbi:MAG: hypothetical protein M3O01_00305, partial [Pseudomonadota bacterium]|nr:hypothetical protein [Pseudomonadota bacterium]